MTKFRSSTIAFFVAALGLAVLEAVAPCRAFSDSNGESFPDYKSTPAHKAFDEVSRDRLASALNRLAPSPRILLTNRAVDQVRSKIELDPRLRLYFDALRARADAMLDDEPVARVLEGRRLLRVSRQALDRMMAWSFLYRYFGDEKYALRVEKEALAISAFEDWNPSHFLDVAEMTTALAVGYDACKDVFSESSREIAREALWQKGVLESLKVKGAWKQNNANWNQVCWCGTAYGALAVMGELDSERNELLVSALLDAVNGVTWSMASFEPDGNYTEGPGYWAYGVGFNILLLSALENALGDDFGLSDAPGFLKTISYYEHVFGATGDAFNYPDSGGGKMFEPTAFWFGRKLGRPELLWNEERALDDAWALAQKQSARNGARTIRSLVSNRLAVAALLWSVPRSQSSSTPTPEELGYIGVGNGRCCVALFRTSWQDDGAYLGVKCGTPNAPHGHLDEGGFVYDDDGVRWIVELGPEDYNRIEQMGMHLWDMSQKSDRWKLLRYNNYGHSVPTVNGKFQLVDGASKFLDSKIGASGESSFALIDLTPIYRDDLKNAKRKATLEPDGTLVVEDSFTAKDDKPATIERRWIVRATPEIANNAFRLSQPAANNHDLTLIKRIETRSEVSIERVIATCETCETYDSPNPGVFVLIERSILNPGQETSFTTRFVSERND